MKEGGLDGRWIGLWGVGRGRDEEVRLLYRRCFHGRWLQRKRSKRVWWLD